MLVLFALDIFGRPRAVDGRPYSTVLWDLILGLAFLTLPFFGVALGKLVDGPFFSRYFLSSLAGACLIVGIGAGLREGRKWIPVALVSLLLAGVAFKGFNLFRQRMHGTGEWLEEPSTHYLLDTTPGQPLAIHPLLTAEPVNLPIAVLNPFDFIYLVHYDQSLKSRLYLVATSRSEFVYSGFQRLLTCAPITFNPPLTIREFCRRHADYLVYGDPGHSEQVALLGQFGLRINSLTVLKDHFLAHLGT
jgi:hypothetical protein